MGRNRLALFVVLTLCSGSLSEVLSLSSCESLSTFSVTLCNLA